MNTSPPAGPTAPRRLLLNALVSGSIAGALSTLALAVCGKLEVGDAVAPLNGPSQWIYGKHAARRRGWQAPYTPWGIVIHQTMSIMWAVAFEALRRRGARRKAIAATAIGTSALACLVDYRCAPERLTPGFERVLSQPALLVVYGAFAAGLLIGGIWTARKDR